MNLGLELYLVAFWELDSSRELGLVQGPISMLDMMAYAKAFGFDEEQTDCLFYFIRAMDNEYLKHQAKKVSS